MASERSHEEVTTEGREEAATARSDRAALPSQVPGRSGCRFGYLPGPGGRAVVYADGHVEWENK
jgi:prepilin-type processing-associated H-X9-DG protein